MIKSRYEIIFPPLANTLAAAEFEMQKQQSSASTAISIEQAKSQFELEKLIQEAEIKKQLMQIEFDYNMQLKMGEGQSKTKVEAEKEDRKDNRTKIQATQQSELIDQRKNDSAPKNFESSGNDVMGSGMGLGSFGPR